MPDLVIQMNKSRKKSNNNIIKRVSKATSKKFAFLTAGNKVRDYEVVIGLSSKQLKVRIDSTGKLSVAKLGKDFKSNSKSRS